MLFSFFSSRRRHTIYIGDWSSDVCSSDLIRLAICPAAFSVNQPARICRALGSLGFTSRFEDKAQPRAELVPSPPNHRADLITAGGQYKGTESEAANKIKQLQL